MTSRITTPFTRENTAADVVEGIDLTGRRIVVTGASSGSGVETARVVSLSSSAHLRSPVVFDDLHFRERPYDPWTAYAQSKTANVLFAVEATKRWAADDITVNAVMPGGIRTGLQRHQTEEQLTALL